MNLKEQAVIIAFIDKILNWLFLEGFFIYTFIFHYDGEPDSLVTLPLAPEALNTYEKSLNKTISLVCGGEFNILKGLTLRELNFKFLLPKNRTLTSLTEAEFKPPIFYLAKFREFIANKKPLRLTITRRQQDFTTLFAGNILVSFENYKVIENAGEEGDFWIEVNLKEFVKAGELIKND